MSGIDVRTAARAGLRPAQQAACEHGLDVLRVYRGVLLADRLGAGKTWIACGLAGAAASHTGWPVTCVVPARLVPMWRRASIALNLSADVCSHRSASLQRLPAGPRIWVVDEAHAFRNPATLGYRHLAQAVSSGLCVLVTATPLNNRPADVVALLDLFGAAPSSTELD